MNHDPHSPDELEQQLLGHFRAHSHGEPSTELDARILAASRAALVSGPQPRLGERLQQAGTVGFRPQENSPRG